MSNNQGQSTSMLIAFIAMLIFVFVPIIALVVSFIAIYYMVTFGIAATNRHRLVGIAVLFLFILILSPLVIDVRDAVLNFDLFRQRKGWLADLVEIGFSVTAMIGVPAVGFLIGMSGVDAYNLKHGQPTTVELWEEWRGKFIAPYLPAHKQKPVQTTEAEQPIDIAVNDEFDVPPQDDRTR